jgi:hypothetical protein
VLVCASAAAVNTRQSGVRRASMGIIIRLEFLRDPGG